MADPAPDLKARIAVRARTLGFEACGFADVSGEWSEGEGLAAFLADGRHGEMAWMADTLDRRSHPRAMWPDARSAIVLGMNYGPDADPREAATRRGAGAISVYAQGDDYHALIKGRLKQLASFVKARGRCEVKVFVDTAPLMEKPLAQAAGIGWRGKHTNLVSRDFGSWLFLGTVLTTLPLKADPPAAEGESCGSCRACLDACPTAAFDGPYRIDARKCLSYLTIEHAGPWPRAYREAMGARVYGCDDCLAACPWNKFAQAARESRLQARAALRAPRLADLAALDEAGFRTLFHRSPVQRIGRERFLRNVLYAIGNSGDATLAASAERLLDDPSPLLRGAAVWALSRLAAPQAFADLRAARRHDETDAEVGREWDAAV